MIKFKPTAGIIKTTKLDYDLISFILSRIIKLKRRVTLRVEKSKRNYSYYYDKRKVICINTNEGTSLKFIIATLLHEVRHCMQLRQECNDIDFNYTSYWNYYTSPEEKDARRFEKLATEVCKIYKQYKIIENKFKRYDLDSFKELCYNENVDNNDLQLEIKQQTQ
jgi:Zn-dependent peptidase ImmA (M78 family)